MAMIEADLIFGKEKQASMQFMKYLRSLFPDKNTFRNQKEPFVNKALDADIHNEFLRICLEHNAIQLLIVHFRKVVHMKFTLDRRICLQIIRVVRNESICLMVSAYMKERGLADPVIVRDTHETIRKELVVSESVPSVYSTAS